MDIRLRLEEEKIGIIYFILFYFILFSFKNIFFSSFKICCKFGLMIQSMKNKQNQVIYLHF